MRMVISEHVSEWTGVTKEYHKDQFISGDDAKIRRVVEEEVISILNSCRQK